MKFAEETFNKQWYKWKNSKLLLYLLPIKSFIHFNKKYLRL